MPRHANTHAAPLAAIPAKLPPLPLPLPPTTDLLRKNAQRSSPSSPPPPSIPSAASTSTSSRMRRNSTKSAPTPAAPPPQTKGPVGRNRNPRRTRRHWSAEEDALVLRGLQLHGDATNKWILVAEMVPGRTRLQVKSRARRLMPDVYGNKRKRQRRPSAASSVSRSGSGPGSGSGSDQDDDDVVEADKHADLEEGPDGSDVDAGSFAADLRSGINVEEQTISPHVLSNFPQAAARPLSPPPPPPPAPEKRPRRISTLSRKPTATTNLPPLPISPPILSPTFRSTPATLPPLPTSLAPVSPPPALPLATSRRQSIAGKRSRKITPPTSPHSSLSSAPPSPDPHSSPPPTKHAKPNLLDPFTLLPPLSPPNPPYTVHVSPLALALMDMHAHLLQSEIIGLFGGTYDRVAHKLRILDIYPCDSPAHSSSIQCEMDPVAETRAREVFADRGLEVVGWYHSHPTFDPWPSVRDVENQGVYQRLFATALTQGGDVVEPFVGAIVTPYHAQRATVVSDVAFYYVGGEAHDVPYRIEEVRDEALVDMEVQALDVFDGFCDHHLKEMQHLANEYRGWNKYAKMKHSMRSQSGMDLDSLIDQFVAKVLGPDLLVECGNGGPKVDDDEGEVDV